MSLNEKLIARVRELIAAAEKKVEEKKMFGGVCFMVNDKMCAGVNKDRLMVRIDPVLADEMVEQPGARLMTMGGKEMKGYVLIDESALGTKKQLTYWVNMALAFNQFAKSSKKK